MYKIQNSNFLYIFTLGVAFFICSVILEIFFSSFIIPNFESLHKLGYAQGSDSVFFNQVAIDLSSEIKKFGWTHWRLYPTENTAGQSSFLAILYYFFGNNTNLIIPFNAFFNALSGILIYLLALQILDRESVRNSFALIPSILFVIFPSSIVWVSQINKDVYIYAGIFLILYSFLRIFFYKGRFVGLIKFYILLMFGILLISCFRPYLLQIIFCIFLILLFFQFARFLPLSSNKLILNLFCLLIISFAYSGISKSRTPDSDLGRYNLLIKSDHTWAWEKSLIVPDFIDRKLASLAAARAFFINYGLSIKANTMLNIEKKPQNAFELITFLPEATLNAIFSPFPENWFENFSLLKIGYSVEMFTIYISFIGLIFLLRFGYTYVALICLVFALVPLCIYGFVTPNIGSLYRIRYPYEMILVTMGICGWNLFFYRFKLLKKSY